MDETIDEPWTDAADRGRATDDAGYRPGEAGSIPDTGDRSVVLLMIFVLSIFFLIMLVMFTMKRRRSCKPTACCNHTLPQGVL